MPCDDTQSIDNQDTETNEQQQTADDSSVTIPGDESAVSILKQKSFASPKRLASRTEANTGAHTDNVGKAIVKYFQSRKEKNEDEQFLDSLKPMLARVPDSRKFECKMAVMNLIHMFESQVSTSVVTATQAYPMSGDKAVTDYWVSSSPSSSNVGCRLPSVGMWSTPQSTPVCAQGSSGNWPPIRSHLQADQGSPSAAVSKANQLLFYEFVLLL